MHGESKAVVDECEQKLGVMKELKKQEREAKEMAAASGK
jgi:hypothetical protein